MAGGAAGEGTSGGRPWRLLGWCAAGCLLLVPLAAMQFTSEVRWDVADFAFAAVLIGGAGLGVELVFRRSAGLAYRAAGGIALATALLLVWINAAVGLVGDEGDPANRPFAAVLAVALAGAALARLRPAGMSRAMGAAAVAQVLAPAAAWAFWPASRAAVLAPTTAGLTVAFVGAWTVSAWLFARAAARAPCEAEAFRA